MWAAPAHPCTHGIRASLHSKWIFRQGTAEALDQSNGAGLGRVAGEPGLFDQVSSKASVDYTQYLAHDRRPGGKQTKAKR